MSGLFDDDPAPPRRPAQSRPQRSRVLLGTAIVVIAAFFLLSAFTGIWTDKLWFGSVGYGDVFTKVLGTRVLLFVLFGMFLGGFVAANIYVAFRTRPAFRTLPSEANLDRYRDAVEPMRKWVVIAVGVLLGLIAGGSASGQWRTFLLWRHGQEFGQDDPYFKKDIGFFVFDLPWLHYIVNFALMTSVLGFVAAIIVHYLFGGISLQSKGDKVSGAAQVQLSVLLGLFVLFKAVDYWLDRYDLTTDQGRRFTGINYTAFNAVLPSKNILMFIALICALLFFANIFRRTWLLPAVGLGLLVLSAILLGALWPGIVWQFQVKPSQPDKEEQFLAKNIDATRDSYGIADVEEQQYNATVSVTKQQLKDSADSLPGIRLIDPARMSQAFEQLQQVRGYYSVAPVLDVDRYPIPGKDGEPNERDLVLGVRELDQAGLVSDQRNWANEHTVYTHGFGVVAAYGNARTADEEAPPTKEEPPWAEEDLPPRGELTDLSGPDGYEARIYFGEKSPSYSIVGKLDDGNNIELDIPEEDSGQRGTTTYDGADGVDVGNVFNKLLYALKFGEPNIMLSSRVNENSKILYERHPRDRVEKVAPWLTVDGDPYPAVVDGRVKWVLDGYTTTDRYPNAERASFQEMISDSLSSATPYVTLPTDQINYIRNSVKAVVDAYDGTVTLYQWQDDPILDAWKEVFPGVVEPKESIPDELLSHLRYPEDLFKVQRYMLAQYHITEPQDFYKGTDLWDVPQDPADTSKKQPPYRLSVQLPAPTKEEAAANGTSEGTSAGDGTPPDPDAPVFSLTSVYVPTNRSNLAAFISVNSDATNPDYGKIRVLRLPDSTQVQGPSQISNIFSSDERIQNTLLGIKQSSTVVNGNLLTLPVGGGLLYVQPVYALQQTGQGSYPVLQFVLASFGTNAGFGNTLGEAIADVLLGSGTIGDLEDLGDDQPGKGDGGKGDGGKGDNADNGPRIPADVLSLLRQADNLYAAADEALQERNVTKWARLQAQAERLVQRALLAAEAESGGVKG